MKRSSLPVIAFLLVTVSTSLHPQQILGSNEAAKLEVLPNYPNPSNPSTTISFGLPEAGRVNLSLFDINGRLIETLADNYYDAGSHMFVFNTLSKSSGMYLLRMIYESSLNPQLNKVYTTRIAIIK